MLDKIYRNTSNIRFTFKIIAIICFINLIIALFIANNSPAIGYESSIYKSTPIFIWISLILSYIFGFIIVIHHVFKQDCGKDKFWAVGALLILLSYTIILSLFIIRGYHMWSISGDVSTHIGYIRQIVITGHTQKDLFYPISHIYSAEFLQILDIDINILHKFLPLIFGLLYIPFMYLFASSILMNKKQKILIILASSTLMHGWYLDFTPNLLANLFFPLVLFVLVKVSTTNIPQWRILFIIFLFLYPPFHLVPTIALIIILITLWLTKIFIAGESTRFNINSMLRFKKTLLAILVIWAINWITPFYVWKYTLKRVYILMAEGSPSHITDLVETAKYAQGYGYNLTEHFLKLYSGFIAYFILMLVCFPFILKEVRNHNKEFYNIFSLYGPIFLICTSILMLYTVNIGFGPQRLFFYVSIIATVFVGFILNVVIIRTQNRNNKYLSNFVFGLIILFLISISLNGVLNIYPSPHIISPSYQTTETEIKGMDWFFHTRNLEMQLTGISVAPGRFADFLLSPQEKRSHDVTNYLTKDDKVTFHFGYDKNITLSESYAENTYLIISQKDKLLYTDVYPRMAEYRWTQNDFDKLNDDSSVNNIYANGGFDLKYIIT